MHVCHTYFPFSLAVDAALELAGAVSAPGELFLVDCFRATGGAGATVDTALNMKKSAPVAAIDGPSWKISPAR